MAKYSKRTVRVTKQHNEECRRLLRLMGVPVVEVCLSPEPFPQHLLLPLLLIARLGPVPWLLVQDLCVPVVLFSLGGGVKLGAMP